MVWCGARRVEADGVMFGGVACGVAGYGMGSDAQGGY